MIVTYINGGEDGRILNYVLWNKVRRQIQSDQRAANFE